MRNFICTSIHTMIKIYRVQIYMITSTYIQQANMIKGYWNKLYRGRYFCGGGGGGSLSESAQKAIWATQIQRLIESAQLPTHLEQPSLRQRVLSVQVPRQGLHFQEEYRQNVLALFQEGVKLDSQIYDHGWLVKGSQDERSLSSNFIFSPSVLVTKSVFQLLNRQQASDCFLYGRFGIGKSASIALCLQLNMFICSYFCEADKDPMKRQELLRLQAMRLLNLKALKYFYWSINLRHQFNDRLAQDLITQQATELTPAQIQELKNCKDYFHFVALLRQFYPKNISLRSIADDVNTFTSKIYSTDYQMLKLQKLLSRNPTKQNQQLLYEQKKSLIRQSEIPAIQTQRILWKFVFAGQHFCLSSSYPISKRIFGESRTETRLLHLNILKNKEFPFHRIPFQSQLSRAGGSFDFIHTIWFQIERRLKDTTNPKTRAALKKSFYTQMTNYKLWGFIKVQCFIIFLDENIQEMKCINCSQSQRKFIQKMIQAVKDLEDEGMSYEVHYLERFFMGEDSKKKAFVFKRLAEDLLQDKEKKHQIREFTDQYGELRYMIDREIMEDYQYREKMPFQILDNSNIRLPWTPQQFLKLFSESLYSQRESRKIWAQEVKVKKSLGNQILMNH